MNGRVYDPFTGRFLSGDPLVQDPYHSQSYNRYTYVWNNPTNLTDPTGFEADAEGNGNKPPPDPCGPGVCHTTYYNQSSSTTGGDKTATTNSGSNGSSGLSDAEKQGRARAEKQGAAGGGALGATVGVVVAGACDAGTSGVCALGNPAIVGGSTAAGAAVGYGLVKGAEAAVDAVDALSSMVKRAWGRFTSSAHAASGESDGANESGGEPKKPAKPPKDTQPITNPPQVPEIPHDWESKPGKNGGEIFHPPGTNPADGEHIRVMPPGSSPIPGLEDGYWRWVNGNKQPMDPSTGKPGKGQGDTHIPLPPDSYPVPR